MKCPKCKEDVGSWPFIKYPGLMAVQAGGGFDYKFMPVNGEDYYECFHCYAWFSENGSILKSRDC